MIDSFEAQKVISRYRTNEIVISTFTTHHEWPVISNHPDLDIGTGVMGKASSLALGLALAQPSRKVLVLDGDGSLLMNLGSVVTIANMAPRNLVHFVFENGVYRTTGGQPIPKGSAFSFVTFAKCAGYARVCQYEDLVAFEEDIQGILSNPGPTFVSLKVPAATEKSPLPYVKATAQKAKQFRAAVMSKS